jgi:Skp family chaperone for outer membrane proteins
MSEAKEERTSAGQAWEDVGRQFRSLGESLASAFKSSWEKEETRQHLEKMQAELEAMAAEIARSTQDMVDSEEGQKLKAEVEQAAQSARAAGQQTAEELQPHLLEAFRRVRSELDQIITRLEREQKKDEKDDRASVS